MNVFRHVEYLTLLKEQIQKHKSETGYLSRLAKAAGMHLSYLSRVQKGQVHLTPDHAAGIAAFWRLPEEATAYFIDLVHLERAATTRLRKLLEQKLSAARRKHDISGVSKTSHMLPQEHSAMFFSSWRYSALHAALRIPRLRTEEALAHHLRLPLPVISDCLQELEKMGLARRQGDGWRPATNNAIYASANSWQGKLYVRDWRHFMASRQSSIAEDEYTYTGTFTLSRKDAARVRRILKDSTTACSEIKEASSPEELYLIAIDWVKV